jgi:hypothetical protein
MSRQEAVEARFVSPVNTLPKKVVSLLCLMSAQIEQLDVLHDTGFLLAKFTNCSSGEGSFAEMCCTLILFADRFTRRS